MQPPHDLNLGVHLDRYRAGVEPFDDFQDWLVGAIWGLEHRRDHCPAEEDMYLGYRIENRVAEYTGDDITEDQLKEAGATICRPICRPSRRNSSLPPRANRGRRAGKSSNARRPDLLAGRRCSEMTDGLDGVRPYNAPVFPFATVAAER